MNRADVGNLFAYAGRLGTTPRQVLICAARMSEHENADAGEALCHLRLSGVRYCPLVDACANLLLTPVASYAHDSLDHALQQLWQGAPQAEP